MSDFLSDPRIAKLYKEVPPAQLDPFRQFRADHPFKHLAQGNVDWEYYDLGSGPKTRLVLTGALGIPYFDWHHLAHFAKKSRVIDPVYAPVKTMDDLCDGIAGILRHEGIENVHVQGGSYGGFVAQVFVRRYPEMVKSLILSHTQPPYPDDPGIKQMEGMLRWMSLMPTGFLRRMMRLSLNRLMPPKKPGNELMLAIYAELLQKMSKADALSTLSRTISFQRCRFTPDDLAAWPGRLLIMMSEDDRTTPTAVRADFKKLYPQAQVHLFKGSGHTTSWDQAEEYRRVIDKFVGNQ